MGLLGQHDRGCRFFFFVDVRNAIRHLYPVALHVYGRLPVGGNGFGFSTHDIGSWFLFRGDCIA
jgi:hypothetical protein